MAKNGDKRTRNPKAKSCGQAKRLTIEKITQAMFTKVPGGWLLTHELKKYADGVQTKPIATILPQ
jgi:hypothetical protein